MNRFFYRQLGLLTVDELKQLCFRKKALFALILYAGILFLTFLGIAKMRGYVSEAIPTLPIEPEQRIFLNEYVRNFKLPDVMTEKVPMLKTPLPLLLYFLISIASLPFLIPTVSCDMISNDTYKGTQRFLLFRVSRTAYFLSKAIAHFILFLAVQLGLLVLLFGFCLFYAREIMDIHFFANSFFLTLRLIPLILAFLAMTQFISSLISSPVKSLIINNLALLLMVILLAVQPVLSIFYQPIWAGLLSFEGNQILYSHLGFITWSILFWGFSYTFFMYKKL